LSSLLISGSGKLYFNLTTVLRKAASGKGNMKWVKRRWFRRAIYSTPDNSNVILRLAQNKSGLTYSSSVLAYYVLVSSR